VTTIEGHILLSMPLTGLTRSLRWKDGIADGLTGVEARVAFQRRPFVELIGKTSPAGTAESRRDEDAIRAALEAGRCAWVDWSVPALVTGLAGDDVTLESAGDYEGIRYAYAWPEQAHYTVASLAGETLTLSDASGLSEGSVLYPIRFGYLDGTVSGTGQASSRFYDLNLFERALLGPVDGSGIDGSFSFWQTDPGTDWSVDLTDAFWILYWGKGSITTNSEDEALAALTEFRSFLRDKLYGGDEALTDEHVRVGDFSILSGNTYLMILAPVEDFFGTAQGPGENQSTICVHIANDVRETQAPSPYFLYEQQYPNVAGRLANRPIQAGVIYLIEEDGHPDTFSDALTELEGAFAGTGNYEAFGPGLSTYDYAFYADQPSTLPSVQRIWGDVQRLFTG